MLNATFIKMAELRQHAKRNEIDEVIAYKLKDNAGYHLVFIVASKRYMMQPYRGKLNASEPRVFGSSDSLIKLVFDDLRLTNLKITKLEYKQASLTL